MLIFEIVLQIALQQVEQLRLTLDSRRRSVSAMEGGQFVTPIALVGVAPCPFLSLP